MKYIEWGYILDTYTAKRRIVLGYKSPMTKTFPEAREISRGLREILEGRGKCSGQMRFATHYILTRGSVRPFSQH